MLYFSGKGCSEFPKKVLILIGILMNPLKAEYLIPTFIGELLSEGEMSVKVLRTNDTWHGMTYKGKR